MGVHPNIDVDRFPVQSVAFAGKKTNVCFNYDASRRIEGEFVRADREHPFVTIIKLDDGRYVLATECMHSPPM